MVFINVLKNAYDAVNETKKSGKVVIKSDPDKFKDENTQFEEKLGMIIFVMQVL